MNSIVAKVTLILAITIAVVVLITSWYSASVQRKASIHNSQSEITFAVEKYVASIKENMEKAMVASRTMASMLESYKKDENVQLDRSGVDIILQEMLLDNPIFFGVYTIWEPNAFDNRDSIFVNTIGTDASGRYIPYWSKDEDNKVYVEANEYDTEKANFYLIPKRTRKEHVDEPMSYNLASQERTVILTGLVAPILLNDRFLGIAGVDLDVTYFQDLALELDSSLSYEGLEVSIFSHKGIVVGSTMLADSLIGLSLDSLEAHFVLLASDQTETSQDTQNKFGLDIKKLLAEGQKDITYLNGNLNVFVPVNFENSNLPWGIYVHVPERTIISSANSAMYVQIIIGFVLLILAIGISYLIFKRSFSPLVELSQKLVNISKGDLSTHISITTKDEIGTAGNAMNEMVTRLHGVVDKIAKASDAMVTATQEMDISSQRMSEASMEQASSAEEISASMEEMVSNIEQNSSNAKSTMKLSDASSDGILSSNESVMETISMMEQITNKNSIIGEIARQTNLLALNAAVEAARAGEQGKGFAVVASEIRRLAERSQDAAAEIDEVSIKGVEVAGISGGKLDEIVPHIQSVAKLLNEIVTASTEQKTGADQVNNAIQELNTVVQQNASISEQMAANTQEINTQAAELKSTVSYFKLNHD
jgi:methyl-accepting chemotaxis protein